MTTIHGIPRKEGVAVAIAAIVDAQLGVSAVSPALLQEGLAAIRRMASPVDYPEAVLVCDTLAVGASTRIPGINIVAIAAESEADIPGLAPEVPCVTGLTGLFRAASHDDILIVDGNKGVVHIDPDPQTLVHYQEMEERHASKPPVYIESEHIPARTQSGVSVLVYGLARDEADVAEALHQGADGLLVEATEEPGVAFYSSVLTAAAGKPVVFSAQYADPDLLRAVARYALPMQVSVALPLTEFGTLMEEASRALESATVEAVLNDLEPPQVTFGARADEHELTTDGRVDSVLVADMRDGLAPRDAVVVVRERLEAVARLAESGVRKIAVSPGTIGEAKYAIRCVGMEDVDWSQ